MHRFAPIPRTTLALAVLAVFSIVVGAGTLFACPLMQAPSCCSKANQGHCPAEQPESCLVSVSENKVATAKPKLAADAPPSVLPEAPSEQAHQNAAANPPAPEENGRDTYLLNRVFLI